MRSELAKAFVKADELLARMVSAVIVFAHKTTASWEAILQAVIDAGWIITGSWPIDTEMEARVAREGQPRLLLLFTSSVVRAKNLDGSVRTR